MEEQLLCHGDKVKLFHKSSPTHKVCPFVSEQDVRLQKEKEEGSLLEFRLVAFLEFHRYGHWLPVLREGSSSSFHGGSCPVPRLQEAAFPQPLKYKARSPSTTSSRSRC